MSKHVLSAAFLALVAIGLAVVIAACGSDAETQPNPYEGTVLPPSALNSPVFPDAKPFVPFTPEQEREIEEVIRADTGLADYLQGTSFTVIETSLWTERHDVIGAGVRIRLSAPTDVGGTVPVFVDDDGGDDDEATGYETTTKNLPVPGLIELVVFVDLQMNEIVAYLPTATDPSFEEIMTRTAEARD